jgi:addiction module HigA family antidote
MATITEKAARRTGKNALSQLGEPIARIANPAHPGEILRELYLEPLDVTITETADALGVSRKHISAIVNGRAPITADMALRLAVVFSTEPEVWVNLQSQYDLWDASQKTRPKVKPLRQAA